MQLDRKIRDVVGQLPANQAHRHRAVRQIGDRARDAGHLLGVRHLNCADSRDRARDERTEETDDTPKHTIASRAW